MSADVETVLAEVLHAHRLNGRGECACGWRLNVEQVITTALVDYRAHVAAEQAAALRALVPEPDNHHNAAACPYCTPETGDPR